MSFHAVIKAEREQKTIKKGLSIYVRFVGLRNADATARKSQHVEGQNEVNGSRCCPLRYRFANGTECLLQLFNFWMDIHFKVAK